MVVCPFYMVLYMRYNCIQDPLSDGLMFTGIGGSNHDDDTTLANPLVGLRKKMSIEIELAEVTGDR